MPINDIDADTFVAFIDISGFKNLMKTNQALKALNSLYKFGYKIIGNNDIIEGLFISDSGILFAKEEYDNKSSLIALLSLIKDINIEMLSKNFMLTCSIAYGHFKYHEMIDLDGIEKNPIYGQAYVSAYLDNENGKHKLKPGECRIITKNLPSEIKSLIDNDSYNVFRLLKPINNYYYYYWMLNNPEDIRSFKRDYKDAYDSRYQRIKKLLENKTKLI